MIRPNIIFSNPNAGGYGGLAGVGSAAFGLVGALVGAAAGSIRIQEAQTVLFSTMPGLQKAAAEGSAKVQDFGGLGGLAGFGGGIGGYGRTAEGKLIAAAFLDAYNKLLRQVGGGTIQVAVQQAPSAPTFEAGASYMPTITLNLRAGAGTDAAVIGSAQPGATLVTTGERDGSCWQVRNGPGTGWVAARYLEPAT